MSVDVNSSERINHLSRSMCSHFDVDHIISMTYCCFPSGVGFNCLCSTICITVVVVHWCISVLSVKLLVTGGIWSLLFWVDFVSLKAHCANKQLSLIVGIHASRNSIHCPYGCCLRVKTPVNGILNPTGELRCRPWSVNVLTTTTTTTWLWSRYWEWSHWQVLKWFRSFEDKMQITA